MMVVVSATPTKSMKKIIVSLDSFIQRYVISPDGEMTLGNTTKVVLPYKYLLKQVLEKVPQLVAYRYKLGGTQLASLITGAQVEISITNFEAGDTYTVTNSDGDSVEVQHETNGSHVEIEYCDIPLRNIAIFMAVASFEF